MYGSIRSAQLILRLGLALVFLWSGIDMIIEPAHWIAAGPPYAAFSSQVIILIALFQVLVAISLTSGFFLVPFAMTAALYLAVVFVLSGPNETIARDLGLIGGLFALALWPTRPYI